MNVQQPLTGVADAETTAAYCLSQLEIFNWGPFSGFHRMTFDPAGCSLIGQTGSGKTTLVDAIMTLICAQPRYNLASTGGHESDRDLMSYVRGVTGIGGDDESIHTARAGQTMTGISVEFSQGDSQLRLIALLWLDSSSTSQSDMKRLWLFDTSNNKASAHGLADYLQLLQEQGVRSFKLQLKEQEALLVTENKKSFLAQVRRFFEVGENAFVLLNRAAGLKQLNSIDELFRELVLDNRAAFKRAAEVASEFDDLTGIHGELEVARQQQQSLLPIEKTGQQRQAATQKLALLTELNDLLPQWFAHQGVQLWSQQADEQQHEIKRCKNALEQSDQQARQQQDLVDDHYQRYQQLGGASIEDLKRQIDDQQQQLIRLQQNTRDYQQLCQALSFKADISSEQLLVNQQLAEKKLATLKTQLDELESSREQQTQHTLNAEDQHNTLSKEINEVMAAPDSSIPGDYRYFQQALANELQISLQQIPYIGQCIEVQEKPWQGAIERAIGSHRLRLVVAAADMPAALNWVNQRNNRLHVRLLNSADYQQTRNPLDDGFCHKLKFKQGRQQAAQQAAVKCFLASIDRHCVESADELRNLPYGLSREGLMSGKKGLFEKHDQRPLNQGWITGFDNRARLTELKQQQAEAKQLAQDLRQQLEVLKTRQQHLIQQKSLLEHLQTMDYSELDTIGAEAVFQQLEQRLQALQNPESDTAKAEKLWDSAKNALATIQQNIHDLKVKLERAQDKRELALSKATQAKNRIPQPLTSKQLERTAAKYAAVDVDQREQLADIEREAMQALQQKISRQQQKLSNLEGQLGRQMVSAKQKDTGALNEAGTELEDVPAYLEQLQRLTREALPDKLERFLQYLNQSSDQGVTQLLTRIENEVSVIEERIEELNVTLRAVDFQAGKYLQLQPQKVSHESLQTLHKAQRHLRSAALQDDQGESHYKALMALIQLLRDAVERKRTRPAQALLDPRYRLQFSVAIIERDSGKVLETRTGSKGGSGGEKEIIASFILTASLSYALCPKNSTTPLFGTVILDEAFSKSSQAVAARIISALREFGLHPLFVTPNKEMRLLRKHTASAVLVHRRQQQSAALSLSWQEIDQHLRQRE